MCKLKEINMLTINKSPLLKKIYILIISVDFYVSLARFFFLLVSRSTFPEVRVRPNDTDPTGSGFETLLSTINIVLKCYKKKNYVTQSLVN